MEYSPFESRLNIESILSGVESVKKEFGKLLVGQPQMIELLLAGILSDGHVLIEGVPGVAKTLAAKILARTVDVGFSRVQFTPDLMPSDVLGTSIFNMKSAEFEFRAGPIFSNIVLIDEINRAPAKTQSALFEVMEERQVTLDGKTHKMEAPFMVVATQNPVEQEGTYRLPEAQLDRFLFKIEVSYPSVQEEIQMLASLHERKGINDLSQIKPVLTKAQIQSYRQVVQAVHVDTKLFNYIAGIIQETRKSGDIFLGASPRATIYLMNAAKSLAVLRGRDFITPEDVKFMALPVLRHRIILTPEKEMEGFNEDDIIKRIMDKVEVPR